MKNIYAQHRAIDAQYQTAKKAGSEEGMAQARKVYKALDERINEKGTRFASVYRLYKSAMDAGNAYIDINDIYQYRDEAELIASFRECGIDTFTFSSGWSSAVDSAWAFTQNGCTLQGMVQINSKNRTFSDDEYEKRNAFLFKVQEA